MLIDIPFDDIFRIDSASSEYINIRHIDSDENINISPALTFPSSWEIPTIKQAPMLIYPVSSSVSSAEASPASAAPNTPPPASAPLAWTAADFDYFLSAICPGMSLAGGLVLEEHLEDPQDLFSAVRLELYLRIKSDPDPVPSSAYAASAPIGTGRRITKILKAHASGATLPLARQALAKAILKDQVTLNHIVTFYDILNELHHLPSYHLQSLKRGIHGMGDVDGLERVDRLAQFRGQGRAEVPHSFEVRLEVLILNGGYSEWERWSDYVDVALGLGDNERNARARTYRDVVDFLAGVAGDLKL